MRIEQSFSVQNRGHDFERHPERTPIVINSFNRVTYLRSLVDALRSRGYENIYVIDNASTYAPLHEYYRREGLKVFYLDTNVGYLALWRTRVWSEFSHNYYVYTDSDVVPVEECPQDFIAFMFALLKNIPPAGKVGFGLKIDDLPEENPLSAHVIAHERRFWADPVDENVYIAPVDTTFALYRPRVSGGFWVPALRTGFPYVARHLPWYEDPENPSEEIRFYQSEVKQKTHWTALSERTIRHWPPRSGLLPWSTVSALSPAEGAAEVGSR